MMREQGRTLALSLLLVDVVEALGLNKAVNEGTSETSAGREEQGRVRIVAMYG